MAVRKVKKAAKEPEALVKQDWLEFRAECTTYVKPKNWWSKPEARKMLCWLNVRAKDIVAVRTDLDDDKCSVLYLADGKEWKVHTAYALIMEML